MKKAADSNSLFAQRAEIGSRGILTTIASAQDQEQKGHKPGDKRDRNEGGNKGRQGIRLPLGGANVLITLLHLNTTAISQYQDRLLDRVQVGDEGVTYALPAQKRVVEGMKCGVHRDGRCRSSLPMSFASREEKNGIEGSATMCDNWCYCYRGGTSMDP